jgi:hypothetical protein
MPEKKNASGTGTGTKTTGASSVRLANTGPSGCVVPEVLSLSFPCVFFLVVAPVVRFHAKRRNFSGFRANVGRFR